MHHEKKSVRSCLRTFEAVSGDVDGSLHDGLPRQYLDDGRKQIHEIST